MAPFPQSEAEAAVVAAFGKPLARDLCELRPGGRRRFDRAGALEVGAEVDEDGARKAVAVKILRPGVERRFKADLDAFFYVARKAEGWSAGGAAAAADRSGGDARALGGDRNGFPPRGRGAVGDGGEHARGRRLPRARRGLEPHRARRAHAGMDRGHAAQRSRRARRQGLRPAGARPHGDPELPAPGAARRLLPRRHASGQSVRRRRRPPGRGRLRHHGPARARRSGASSPKSCSASSPATITAPRRCISTPATCRASIRWKASRRRSAPSASRSTTAPPKTSRWRSC